eukprot:jgi/Undpi1/13567/HiC_scaffold_8.g03226.m1
MKTKCLRSAEKTADAHAFMTDLHRKGCFVIYLRHSQKRITCVLFATPEQVELLTHYGSVIIQDNTFTTNAYKYQLCLVVIVDQENRTQIACQVLVLRERTEDFVFSFEGVAEMGKKHLKVIFTDADKVATATIAQVFPNSLHKYYIFHAFQIIWTHLGELGSVSSKVVATFQAAAYALTESVAFNWACVASRWRTNATDWTMEPIASKPARLTGTNAEGSAVQQKIALGSSVLTPSIGNVRSANYANCCTIGKEAEALLDGITTIEGANRILRHCKKALLDSIAVEEETQREERVVSSQGFALLRPFVAGLNEPEKFAQARGNSETLLSNGAQMVAASSALVQPGPSPSLARPLADLALEEDYVTPKIARHRGKSKRHRTGAGRRVPGAGHMAWNS